MMDREEALDQYLARLRRDAVLTIPQVCERTKIQGRYVSALEEGRYGELPSNTHLRAFSLAIVQACGGDEERAALLVRRVLSATGALPPETGPSAGSGQAQVAVPEAKAEAPAPKAAAPVPRPVAASAPRRPEPMARPIAAAVAVVAVPQPAESARVAVADAAEGLVQNASQKLKALPWQALLGLALGAALLSGGLLWGVHAWQSRSLAPQGEAVTAVPGVEIKAAVTSPATATANAAASAADAAPAPAAVPAAQLVLRARRPCWLVLQIDGQKLPTVTLEEGEKRSWPVTQKAVLLAGNVGALRVWWRGDNLGYLGELSTRQNGLTFEAGKAFRVDHGHDLALPAGVPE